MRYWSEPRNKMSPGYLGSFRAFIYYNIWPFLEEKSPKNVIKKHFFKNKIKE